MPRTKLTRQLLDDLKVDRRTEFYDTVIRDLELRIEAEPSAVRTWFVRYSPDGSERRVRFKLGRYPEIPITIAREKAQRIIAEALHGKDPAARREEDRAAITVRTLGELYIDRHAKRFKRTWRQDELMLASDVYPFIGEHKANKVTRRDLLDLLEHKLDKGKLSAARNLKALLSKLFNWAVEQDHLETSPADGLKAPGVPARRDRVLSRAEVRIVWNALPSASLSDSMRDVFRLLMLTGQRAGEVAGMRRAEIDLDHALWTIPGERTKNGERHEVPLASPALAIVAGAMARTQREAFFSRTDKPFDSNAVSHAARLKLQVLEEQWQPHDLRRTFVTLAADLDIEPHVIEAAINHRSGFRAGVAGIYNKNRYAVRVRTALDKWADHLMDLVGGRGGDVVHLNKKRR